MIQYDEIRLAMEALTPEIEELRGALNLDGIKIKLDELEMKTTEPNFWDDPEKSQSVLQQIGQYKGDVAHFPPHSPKEASTPMTATRAASMAKAPKSRRV